MSQVMLKSCTKCFCAKTLDLFPKQAKGKFGVSSICKACNSLRGIEWHKKNRERSLKNKSAYNLINKAANSSYSKRWRTKNAPRIKEVAALWTAANLDRKRASTAKRRAMKLRATPSWAKSEDLAAFYSLATRLTAKTGVAATVDHIVPLQSPIVCGLHCPANLSILPDHLNKRKGNHWWPHMPGRDPELDIDEAYGYSHTIDWIEGRYATTERSPA